MLRTTLLRSDVVLGCFRPRGANSASSRSDDELRINVTPLVQTLEMDVKEYGSVKSRFVRNCFVQL